MMSQPYLYSSVVLKKINGMLCHSCVWELLFFIFAAFYCTRLELPAHKLTSLQVCVCEIEDESVRRQGEFLGRILEPE